MSNKTTILVQGAGSRVGCSIVHLLTEKIKFQPNFCVRAGFTNMQEPNCQKCQADCECVNLDLTNRTLMQEALKNVNKLVIIPPYRENRVTLTNGLVDLAYTMGVRRVVLLSVIGANNEEIIFQKNLKTIENHIISKGDMVYTFLRLPAYMDNFLDMTEDIKQGSLVLPLGDGKFPPIWSKDIADFVSEILWHDTFRNQGLDLTGPETLGGHDIARTFTETTGKQVNYISMAGEEWKKMVTKKGMNEWKAEGILELFRWYSSGKGQRVSDEFQHRMNRLPTFLPDFIQANLSSFRVTTLPTTTQ